MDSHDLGKVGLCHLRLHKNSALPWFILIPEVPALEIFEMTRSDRVRLRSEMDLLAAFVKELPRIEKINVAAIGNLVPQLYIHVIGRYQEDPFWPGVVWGQELSEKCYSTAEVEHFKSQIQTVVKLGLTGQDSD